MDKPTINFTKVPRDELRKLILKYADIDIIREASRTKFTHRHCVKTLRLIEKSDSEKWLLIAKDVKDYLSANEGNIIV